MSDVLGFLASASVLEDEDEIGGDETIPETPDVSNLINDEDEEDDDTEEASHTAGRYPFAIISDHHQGDAAWPSRTTSAG